MLEDDWVGFLTSKKLKTINIMIKLIFILIFTAETYLFRKNEIKTKIHNQCFILNQPSDNTLSIQITINQTSQKLFVVKF
ncbi:hypothetical protein CBG25_01430 [Arsenophonus sp. ENCA]|nr:hypothetical protein CBG25_01430 [Arsenophonus sp. ENCA]